MYDVIVVGLGGMGSAVAAHAASRGLRVLGVEQFVRGHELGASAGRSRIIRKAYYEDPRYVPLLVRAYELWRELERATSLDVLRITGMVSIGPEHGDAIAGALRSAREHDLAIEELDRKSLRARFPAFSMRADEVALFDPEAGILAPEAAIEAHVRVALAHGAELRYGTRAAAWDLAAAPQACVSFEDGARASAHTIVFCLGPWFDVAPELLGVHVRVQRNIQVWFRPSEPAFGPDRLPVFFADRPEYPKPLYGFPDLGDGVKAAFHGFGETTTPAGLQRDVSESERRAVGEALEELVPGSAGIAALSKACMYSLTPDEHFALGRHPEFANAIVAGGFSGHGFKFCSVVGEVVADIIVRGKSRHNVTFLCPARFR